MNTQQAITQLEHRLRNAPHGIPYSQLPKEPEIIEHMRQLYRKDLAIWCKHYDEWYFILLREPGKPPMGIKKWIWQ